MITHAKVHFCKNMAKRTKAEIYSIRQVYQILGWNSPSQRIKLFYVKEEVLYHAYP